MLAITPVPPTEIFEDAYQEYWHQIEDDVPVVEPNDDVDTIEELNLPADDAYSVFVGQIEA